MALREVQSNQGSYQGPSIITPTLVGGLSGYAAKWLLPLNSAEKDGEYNNQLENLHEIGQKARNEEIEAIRATKQQVEGRDEFIRSVEAKELKPNLSWPAKDLLARVESVAEEAKARTLSKITTEIKCLRPAETFILIGAGVGLAFGLLRNSLSWDKEDQ